MSFKVSVPSTGFEAVFDDVILAETEAVRSAAIYGEASINDVTSGDSNLCSLRRQIVQVQAVPYVFVDPVSASKVLPSTPKFEVVGVDGSTWHASDAEVRNSLASMLAQGFTVGNDGVIHAPPEE